MARRFIHFIITRFNLRSGDGSTRHLGPQWLARRFGLFDRFCYPSVRGQSCANFTWLVMFDRDTPHAFKTRIDQYAREPGFVPVYLGHSSIEETRRIVRERLPGGSDLLITTRLDND